MKYFLKVWQPPASFSLQTASKLTPSVSRTPRFLMILSHASLQYQTFICGTTSSQEKIGNGAGDSGDDLWNYAKDEIDTVIKNKHPQFIIVLGDLPAHRDDVRMEGLKQAIADLHALSDKNKISLLYVPGNNDSYGGDYKPFSGKIFEAIMAGPLLMGLIPRDTR
jgi:hypothetical protein